MKWFPTDSSAINVMPYNAIFNATHLKDINNDYCPSKFLLVLNFFEKKQNNLWLSIDLKRWLNV